MDSNGLQVRAMAAVVAAGCLAVPGTTRAQTTTTTAIEWNVVDGTSIAPRALVINDVTAGTTGPVWYVTQGTEPFINAPASARLVRFTPGIPIDTQPASFASWDLSFFFVGATTGLASPSWGFKIAPGQIAFVRTSSPTFGFGAIHRVDTLKNIHTIYEDDSQSSSDVGVDPSNAVYTTGPNGAFSPCVPNLPCDQTQNTTFTGFVERLVPIDVSTTCMAQTGAPAPCAQVTRWPVDGHPGNNMDPSAELSGVAVQPGTGKLVYFADSSNSRIGELDPVNNMVRYFPLTSIPGQLVVDRAGAVYAVTNVSSSGGGSLVRIDPKTNQMTTYCCGVTAGASRLVGIGPRGALGFTESSMNTIGMVIPGGTAAPAMVQGPFPAPPLVFYIQGAVAPDAGQNFGTAAPTTTSNLPVVVTDTGAGKFEEVTVPDVAPKGIARDPGPLGTFFYAVNGATVNRIGRVFLPIQAAKFVTGSGAFPVLGGAANLAFTVSQQDLISPITGELFYSNPGTGDNLQSLALTGLTIANNTATIAGTCTNNGIPCTFTANIVDNLLLGQADTFAITPVVGTAVTAALSEGSIRIKQ